MGENAAQILLFEVLLVINPKPLGAFRLNARLPNPFNKQPLSGFFHIPER